VFGGRGVGYLGVTLQTSGKSFKQHVKERASAALRAMHDIENLRLLSLDTAMKLFSVKITPILTYGLEQIWDHLTVNDLTTLENVKATYLERTLCQGSRRPGLRTPWLGGPS
jgi:hypothetical protein